MSLGVAALVYLVMNVTENTEDLVGEITAESFCKPGIDRRAAVIDWLFICVGVLFVLFQGPKGAIEKCYSVYLAVKYPTQMLRVNFVFPSIFLLFSLLYNKIYYSAT